MTPDTPRLLSAASVARLLDVSPVTVRRLRDSGALHAVKLGAAVRYTSESVAAYIKNLPAA